MSDPPPLVFLGSPAGMQALFEIKKCFPNVHKPRPFGAVREYFIAAEEVLWDYGPTKINHNTGRPLTSDRSKTSKLSKKRNSSITLHSHLITEQVDTGQTGQIYHIPETSQSSTLNYFWL